MRFLPPRQEGDRSAPIDPSPEVVVEDDDLQSRQAYDGLFRAHYCALYGVAMALCGEPALAEDCVSEAFTKVWPRWQRGQVTDVGLYLKKTVLNEVRQVFRRRLLQRRELERQRSLRTYVTPHDTALVDRTYFDTALLRLPLRQREAVVLRYLQDLSERDAAAAMGVSVGAIKTHTSRGLDALRSLLGRDGPP